MHTLGSVLLAVALVALYAALLVPTYGRSSLGESGIPDPGLSDGDGEIGGAWLMVAPLDGNRGGAYRSASPPALSGTPTPARLTPRFPSSGDRWGAW